MLNVSSIPVILKEGTVVSTRLFSCSAWHRNIIYKSKGDTVYLAYVQSYLEGHMLDGSKIIIKCSNDYFEYLFEGLVLAINPSPPGYVCVNIYKANEIINSRAYPRYDTCLAAYMKPQWDDTAYFCTVTNISLGGIAFISNHSFDEGDSDATIYLPGAKSVNVNGRITKRRSSRNEFSSYSMQFMEIRELTDSPLSDYISQLEEEGTRLQKEFFSKTKGTLEIE